MTIFDAALKSRSPADSPSYALRRDLAERLATHRGAWPRLVTPAAPEGAAGREALPRELVEMTARPLAAAAS
ncbi:hypothetical protein [Roseomonas sp. USHLN139]|uniref:hypothetical protein n=1 Tax=Roseomonas sp. USHLN139 TaxID=3081298 RepID=UPI003B026A3E